MPFSSGDRAGVPCAEALSLLWPQVQVQAWGPLPCVTPLPSHPVSYLSPAVLSIKPIKGKKKYWKKKTGLPVLFSPLPDRVTWHGCLRLCSFTWYHHLHPGVNNWLLVHFLPLTGQLKSWQATGWEREGEWHASKGPRLGLKPGAAAARTKRLYRDAALPTELNSTQLLKDSSTG